MRRSAGFSWAVTRDLIKFWGCYVWGAFVGRYEGWAGAKGIVGVATKQRGKDGELCDVNVSSVSSRMVFQSRPCVSTYSYGSGEENRT